MQNAEQQSVYKEWLYRSLQRQAHGLGRSIRSGLRLGRAAAAAAWPLRWPRTGGAQVLRQRAERHSYGGYLHPQVLGNGYCLLLRRLRLGQPRRVGLKDGLLHPATQQACTGGGGNDGT